MSYPPTTNPTDLRRAVQRPSTSPGLVVKLFEAITSILQHEYVSDGIYDACRERDEYMLRDVGIGHSEIDRAVERPWRRDND